MRERWLYEARRCERYQAFWLGWHHETLKARESCCGSLLQSVVDLPRALDQRVLDNATLFAWVSMDEDPYMLQLSGTCKGNACLIIVPYASTQPYPAYPHVCHWDTKCRILSSYAVLVYIRDYLGASGRSIEVNRKRRAGPADSVSSSALFTLSTGRESGEGVLCSGQDAPWPSLGI